MRDKLCVLKKQIPKVLNLERKGQPEMLPSALTWALPRSGRANSAKNSYPSPFSANFPGSYLQILE